MSVFVEYSLAMAVAVYCVIGGIALGFLLFWLTGGGDE